MIEEPGGTPINFCGTGREGLGRGVWKGFARHHGRE